MKKSSFIILCLFISTLLFAQEPVNLLKNVNISSDSNGVVIGLDFNGPVSFTSMKLTNPYRIVLDFTDCKKSGVLKNLIKVASDGIKEISISQMGSDSAPLLRVNIITAVDLEFNIEPTDNGINVKIAGVKLAQSAPQEKEEPQNVVEVTPKQQEEVKSEPSPVVSEAKPEPQPEPAPAVSETKPEPRPEAARE